MLVRHLTRVINCKVQDAVQEGQLFDESLNYPFYIPLVGEALDKDTYYCALRVAIKHLELTRRVLIYEARAREEVGQPTVAT